MKEDVKRSQDEAEDHLQWERLEPQISLKQQFPMGQCHPGASLYICGGNFL